MKKNETVDVESEVVTTQAVVKHESQAVQSREPLSALQMRSKLDLIRNVMVEAMTEGQDYGKIPGCGDKPGLFQPGAQKLSMMFQLNPEVREEIVADYPNYNRGFRLVVRVSNGDKFAEGVGECSTLESKYRYRSSGKRCPECGKETIIKGKAEYGGGWLCFQKKGGCGWKCADNTPGAKDLEAQSTGKVENENPPDYWNTVRKMAFKRAFVHSIINATNTSELWSQDLEDLAANGVVGSGHTPKESGDEVPMSYEWRPQGGKEPAKTNPVWNGTAVKEFESAKDATTRATLLQILRKKMGNNKEVEAEACRFFQNVPSKSKQWNGQMLLGAGIDGTFQRMKIGRLEFIVQKFDAWFVNCQKWCDKNPVKK